MAQDVDGRRIAGRYELGVQLGEGGVGIVWRAEDTLLGRPVAIKEVELPPAVRDKQRAALRARVIREARAAARLSHPGAVTLFDVVQDGGQDYIVMELVEAPTLDQLVAAKGPLDPRRAAMVGLRLLATLEAALGATLYFAVEGEPPFKSSKAQFEVLNAIVNDPPRQARRLGALGPVVDRLLRKESHQRPKSADVWYQLRRVAATKDPAGEVPPDPPSTPIPRPTPHAVKAPPTGPAQAKAAPTGTDPAADVPVGTVPAEAKSAVGASASAAPADGAARGTSAGAAPGRPTSAESAPPGAVPADRALDGDASAEGVPAGANPGAADSAGAAPDSGAAGGGTWLRRRRRRSGG